MGQWYAIFCKPRQDARAAKHLSNQGYEVFRPLAQSRGRIESLFPRYLFIQVEPDQSWAPIRSTRGVTAPVRMGTCAPTAVPDDFIAALKERGNINLACPYQKHDVVQILDGPFAGFEALFDCTDGEARAMILLSFLGGVQRVAVPEMAIRLAG